MSSAQVINRSSSVMPEEAQRRDVSQLKEQIARSKSLCSQTKEETLKMRLKHVGPSCTLFFKSNPLKMVHGRGQYMYDDAGNEYLDCINNVSHVGHGNVRVAEAVGRQLSLLNTNSRFLHENLSIYAKRLTDHFPPHLSVCYLVNSGSEANDLAIRLARAHTGRKDIVAVDGAYHGNLTSTMAISPYKTDHLAHHKPCKWAHVAPLPCAYRGQYTRSELGDETTIGRLYADATAKLIDEVNSSGRQVAAFFVESMISCGGQTPLPAGYLRHLQEYLHQNGSLLVCDEVQTGFGRSGKRMWAFQLDGDDIKPDIVTCGKPIGNGFPISAVITTREVAESFMAIGTEYFNTFGGNPASCAAALAVLDELEEKNLMEQANRVGSFILAELRELQKSSRTMGDVRGCGYFIGIEMVENLKTKRASQEFAQFIVERFRDERILMNTEGKLGNVLKFKPPMVFNMDDARRFIRVFSAALTELELKLGHLSDNNTKSRSISSSSASSCSSSSWLESSGEL
uniref:Alanine--glyoxylate aminotransferase 2-like 1 n=1 Tax=Aceria tosichella TaxID=561515 RepID=A0A6G1S7D2_9ACAR